MNYKYLIITLLLVCGFTFSNTYGQTKIIAHRGFWKTDNSAQNSIASLIKAAEIKCYGSEFDVWYTRDNKLVVNHDAKFKGVTMQDATAKVACSIDLDNGESLPSLDQYFDKALQLPDIHLILEMKSLNDNDREKEAAAAIVSKLKEYNLLDRTTIISFSLNACKEFIRLLPQSEIFYLNGELSPEELKDAGFAGASYENEIWKFHTDWIEKCHKLGLKVNVWTIDNEPDMKYFINQHVDFITTNYPKTLQQIISQ